MGFETALFVDKHQPIDQHIICSLCLGVFDRPTTACSNGHAYCEECLKQAKDNQGVCPDCREPILDPAPLSRPLQNMIVEMKLKCEYSQPQETEQSGDGGRQEQGGEGAEPSSSRRRIDEEGKAVDGNEEEEGEVEVCNWVGSVSEYKQHAESCGFQLIQCPNTSKGRFFGERCKAKILKKDLEDHIENSCPHRKVDCSACKKKMFLEEMDSHLEMYCSEGLDNCEHCGARMKRKELGERQSSELYGEDGELRTDNGHYSVCPKMPLLCEFKGVGCKAKLPREEMAAHHASHAQYHASLTSKAVVDARDWRPISINWDVETRDLIDDDVTHIAIESPITSIHANGYEFYLVLSVRRDKVYIELHCKTPRCSFLSVRNIEITTYIEDGEGDDEVEYACLARDLANKTLQKGPQRGTLVGRSVMTADDEGDGTYELKKEALSRESLMGFYAKIEVKRPDTFEFVTKADDLE